MPLAADSLSELGVRLVSEYIRNEVPSLIRREPFTVRRKDVALRLGMRPEDLSRAFKKQTGLSWGRCPHRSGSGIYADAAEGDFKNKSADAATGGHQQGL